MDYWKQIITFGKPNTMMPAFASSRGGPLNVDQVHSLVEYLSRYFPGQATNATNAAASPSARPGG
jgi:hypothetical protein